MNRRHLDFVHPKLVPWIDDQIDRGTPIRVEDPADRDLLLSREQFEVKMLAEPRGLELLLALEGGAWRDAEAKGLCRAGMRGGVVRFEVPRWFALVSFLLEYPRPTPPG